MSAFPNSGRSNHGNLGKLKVRFRPEAAITARFNRAAYSEYFWASFDIFIISQGV
jgi:hypothetical protein